MATIPVIFYRYDTSPYCHKVDGLLALKRIPYDKVQVSQLLPRPEITDYLGVTYRRMPILAIGNDVYCDTFIIGAALERRFPAAHEYGTLYPKPKHGGKTDIGLIKAFTKFYADAVIFPLAVHLIPWTNIPEAFLKDRNNLRGGPIDVKAMVANAPIAISSISTHLSIIEEQLSDSREWIFDTESPSLADVSTHVHLSWGRSFPSASTLFDQNRIPLTIQWLARMTEFMKNAKANQHPTALTGLDAAEKIVTSSYEPYDVVGFDTIEAGRLGVANGDIVQVAPEDTGRGSPTVGKLVALSREEITLEVKGSQGLVRCHFPRIGFFIKPTNGTKL